MKYNKLVIRAGRIGSYRGNLIEDENNNCVDKMKFYYGNRTAKKGG